METLEHLCVFGENVKWSNHYGKQYVGSSKKNYKTKLPRNPAISFLGMYLKKTDIRISKMYFDTSVHDSIIHNSQEVVAT